MNSFKPSNSEYRIESCVGEGLTSIVYKATRIDGAGRSLQNVALKVPKDEIWIPHLRQEFEVLSSLNSPHLTRVLAWESSQQQSALVIEWVEGLTLFEISSCLHPSLMTEVIAQIQLGLSALHERGFHHGDLHPHNIMIDIFGYVKLLDATGGQGSREGSPAYLSPERWKGEVSSYASDLFALGLIQYDLQSGFSNLPESKTEAQTRCLALASHEHALLSGIPDSRQTLDVNSSPELRAELAEIVKRLKKNRKEAMAGTRVAEIDAHFSSFSENKGTQKESRRSQHGSPHGLPQSSPHVPLRSVLGALLFVISIPVGAGSPSRMFEVPTATLNIYSHRWISIEINGRNAGYTPLRIKKIHAGAHRIRWKSANDHGTALISIQPGESLNLNESRLRAASGKGNTLN